MIAATDMRAIRPRTPLQHHLAWLLWLALLVPMAQAAAKWHSLSHSVLDASGWPDSKQAAHEASCGLCLAASATSHGTSSGATQLPPQPSARHALPRLDADGIWPAQPTPAYLSRAPPAALR